MLESDDATGAGRALTELHCLSCVEQTVIIRTRAEVSHGRARRHLLGTRPLPHLAGRMGSFTLGAYTCSDRHHVQLLMTMALDEYVLLLACSAVLTSTGHASLTSLRLPITAKYRRAHLLISVVGSGCSLHCLRRHHVQRVLRWRHLHVVVQVVLAAFAHVVHRWRAHLIVVVDLATRVSTLHHLLRLNGHAELTIYRLILQIYRRVHRRGRHV